MRERLDRLLQGRFRSEDLTQLFLFLRSRCDGRESIREIGDFVAHREERNKGITTRTAAKWYATAHFRARIHRRSGATLNLGAMPSVTPEFLRTNVRNVDAKRIRDLVGLTRSDAKKVIEKFLRAVVKNPDGTYAIRRSLTLKEQKLLNCLASTINAKPAFTGGELFRDLEAVLRSQALLSKGELGLFSRLAAPISLYAIASMHKCLLQFGDGKTGRLYATGGNSVSANVAIPVTLADSDRDVSLAASMFVSGLDPVDHCREELLQLTSWNDCELEVADDMKLAIVR